MLGNWENNKPTISFMMFHFLLEVHFSSHSVSEAQRKWKLQQRKNFSTNSRSVSGEWFPNPVPLAVRNIKTNSLVSWHLNQIWWPSMLIVKWINRVWCTLAFCDCSRIFHPSITAHCYLRPESQMVESASSPGSLSCWVLKHKINTYLSILYVLLLY